MDLKEADFYLSDTAPPQNKQQTQAVHITGTQGRPILKDHCAQPVYKERHLGKLKEMPYKNHQNKKKKPQTNQLTKIKPPQKILSNLFFCNYVDHVKPQ